MGYTVYDGLINWDLSSADKAVGPGARPRDLVEGRRGRSDALAVHAARRREVPRRQRLQGRRRGLEPRQAPERQVAAIRPASRPRRAARAFPPSPPTRRSTTRRSRSRPRAPDAFLPYQISWVMMSSPAQWEKVGKDWNKFAQTPSGTGPWKVDGLRAADPRRAVAQQGLLGQGARAEARQAGAAADPGGRDAHGGAALGPGRLDRGALARRGAQPARRPASRS